MAAAVTHTKGGRHQSTSEEDLQRIRNVHPMVSLVLAHRHASKVLHTFLEGLQPFIAPAGERACQSV